MFILFVTAIITVGGASVILCQTEQPARQTALICTVTVLIFQVFLVSFSRLWETQPLAVMVCVPACQIFVRLLVLFLMNCREDCRLVRKMPSSVVSVTGAVIYTCICWYPVIIPGAGIH